MKKIIQIVGFLTLLMVFLFGICFQQNTSLSARKNAFSDFKVMAIKYRSPNTGHWIDLAKSTPLLEYANGTITFYEVEIGKDGEVYKPRLDNNGLPIKIQKFDKQKVFGTIYSMMGFIATEIEGKIDFENIEIGMFNKFFDDDGDEGHYEIASCYLKKSNIPKGILISIYGHASKKETDRIIKNIRLGSVFLLDNDFNFEFFEPADNGYKFAKQLIINPDTVNLNAFSAQYTENGYHLETQNHKGFILMIYGSNNVIIGGREFVYNKKPLLMANGKLAVNIDLLMSFLFGFKSSDNEEIKLYRLYTPFYHDIPSLIEIKLKVGSKIAFVNDQQAEFAFEPYVTYGYQVYVPLRDVCAMLKAKLRYRQADSSVLIERF